MSNSHLTLTLLPYRKWLVHHPEVKEAQVRCPECNGTGWIDCPHCGTPTTCDLCEGKGYIIDMRSYYKQQLQRDLTALERWAGSKPVIVRTGQVRVTVKEA